MKNKLLNPNFLALSFLGFNSGFAFILPNSTIVMALSFYGFSTKEIGILFLASFPYSLKILWSPIMDHYAIGILSKFLGQRRSWILIAQIGLLLSSIGFIIQPSNIWVLFGISTIFIFFAASQDIVLDAYRIERLSPNELATGTTFAVTGFRIGTLVGGLLPLCLLDRYGWSIAFLPAPILLLIGPIVILLVKEPKNVVIKAKTKLPNLLDHLQTIFQSFLDFLKRPNWLIIILFIFFYKVSDTIPNAMRGSLLAALNFTPIETAQISNAYYNILMILGGFLGGFLVTKLGILRSIVLGSVFQLFSPISYVWLSIIGHSIYGLVITTTIQGLACGVGSTLLVIYISSLCKKDGNTATQYSLIYSFGSLTRVILSSLSGLFASYVTWTTFFIITTLFGLPVFWIISRLKSGHNKLIH